MYIRTVGPSHVQLQKPHPTALAIKKHRHGSSPLLSIPSKRLNSRRLSQIGTKQSFTVKTPLEAKFDMPDLIDQKMLKQVDDVDTIGNTIFTDHKGGMVLTDEEGNFGNEVYFAGIIDILQKYNKRKKVENFFRGIQTDKV